MGRKMTLYVFVLCNCLASAWAVERVQSCLTGGMMDMQSWVDLNGRLTPQGPQASLSLDVSESPQPVATLQVELQQNWRTNGQKIKILSIARCRLREVPKVFSLEDTNRNVLADTIEYLTLYGNKFDDHQSTSDRYDSFINATQPRTLAQGIGYDSRADASWPGGFRGTRFKNLRELDLRACAITTLSGGTFEGMEALEALYLSENSILFINAKAFAGLKKLAHLDLSSNYDYDEFGNHKPLVFESVDVMEDLKNLVSLDFSYTRLSQSNLMMFYSFGKTFQRLSLCETGLTKLRMNFFANTSLRFLDISGNNGVLNHLNALAGIENTLEVLYAAKVGLVNLNLFENFKRLEILNVQRNEISLFTHEVAKTLKNLQILDLDNNRLTVWLEPKFRVMPRLKYLSLRKNNINMINENMIRDFRTLQYLGFGENIAICNCHTRELFESAIIADREAKNKTELNTNYKNKNKGRFSSYHTGFIDYNSKVYKRRNVSEACDIDDDCDGEIYNTNNTASFTLIDYEPLIYQCMEMTESKLVSYSIASNCNALPRDIDYEEVISDTWNKLLALSIIPAIFLPVLVFVYMFRKNFRYFCITVKNSALLSMMNTDTVIDDSRIFNYDVFVSYCNDDRSWILDQLLPHLETNYGVSVCLHERDFQVGLSILENIVSCMDRSRSIMLVISKEFLRSQWCQFEMHLAQHRLLETRREDLILVLLEELPRRLRPTTLHYLMLTKTYIVYPSDGAETAKKDFWRRLGRSVAAKRPENENDSLA